MRALFQGLIGAAAALALSACVVSAPSGGGPGPNPVTGDAIEVTALDPVPDPAKPGDRKEATAPTEKTRGAASAPVAEATVAPEVVAARPAAAGDPRPKPRPQGLTEPAADTPPARPRGRRGQARRGKDRRPAGLRTQGRRLGQGRQGRGLCLRLAHPRRRQALHRGHAMRRRLPGALGHLRAVHAAVRLQRHPAGRRHKDHAVPRLTRSGAGRGAGRLRRRRTRAHRRLSPAVGAPIWSAAAFDAGPDRGALAAGRGVARKAPAPAAPPAGPR
jgi:hypothetical protein